ncbi:hypothetical protein QTP88_003294 [Uroleucon formosanum]
MSYRSTNNTRRARLMRDTPDHILEFVKFRATCKVPIQGRTGPVVYCPRGQWAAVFDWVLGRYLVSAIISNRTSAYLQSSNLNLLSAWEMVEKTIKHISTINFEDIFKETEHFSKQMNYSLEDLKLSENVIVECELPQPRIRSKKRMADELC